MASDAALTGCTKNLDDGEEVGVDSVVQLDSVVLVVDVPLLVEVA